MEPVEWTPREKVLFELSERELRLLANAIIYSENDPAGLPGHNLLVLLAKLAEKVGVTYDDLLSRVDDIIKTEW